MVLDFFFELGQLKRVKRSGWWLAGVKDPETVAEHSFRTAAIGYVLAKLEKADDKKVLLMCLFNDLHEARLNDLHKVGHKYIEFKPIETAAFSEQMKMLPTEVADELMQVFAQFQSQSSKEAIIARDADLLENALQAREYQKQGYDTQNWIDNIRTILKTERALKLLKEIEKSDPNSWWKGLKKIQR